VQEPVRSTAPVPPPGDPSPRRPGAGTVLTLVNGVLAGVAATYATTHSVMITVIAGIMAIVLVLVVLIFPR
jgi:hypothetical protein